MQVPEHIRCEPKTALWLDTGQCATLACLWEATTPKPGNVHRSADFEDLTFLDFVTSAVAVGKPLEAACDTGVGMAVLSAVRATHELVGTNTNLGTVLLLAPLAAVSRNVPLGTGIHDVLSGLNAGDARRVYEAIRLACPGGLGHVPRMDIADLPPQSLREAMQEAAERDLVARQYVNDFEQVRLGVAPQILAGLACGWTLCESIVFAQLQTLAAFPDSLIARKCGAEIARSASSRASRVLESGRPGETSYDRALSDFDFWLRSDQHRRNPGTTADLIAAGLFVLLRDGLIATPFRYTASG